MDAGNPAQIHPEDPTMNMLSNFDSTSTAFESALSLDELHRRVPAVFAQSASDRTSPRYTFIPTREVLNGLMSAGFLPVEARQARVRKTNPVHARHLVRLRRRYEVVELRDAVPEIVFLNSHDGSSNYQLRMGVFRVVCTNGMIVSQGAFPGYCVAHRGNVVDEVIAAAMDMAERFPLLASQVERMERRWLSAAAQIDLAERSLALRYPDVAMSGIQPSQLLSCRRAADAGDDLWRTLNRIQENLMRGGVSRRTPSGRLVRTRGLSAIRQEVRLNSALWDLALEALDA
jgi:hypothetical protein